MDRIRATQPQAPYTHEQLMNTGLTWPCNYLRPGEIHPSQRPENFRMNTTNQTNIKKYALAVSLESRQGKFTRVSKDFLNRIESKTRMLIQAEVKNHPSVGVTLY